MTLTTISDQSHLFVTRRMTSQLRQELDRLSRELSTGRRASAATPASGDLATVLGLRRDLSGIAAYKTAATEARLTSGVAQDVLGRISTQATESSVGMIAAGLSRSGAEIASAAADAKVRFTSVLTALNAEAAGLSLFAGQATDSAAVAEAGPVLDALQLALAGQTTAAGVTATLDAWFLGPGGGFETMAWLGNGPAPQYRIAPGEDVSLTVTAESPVLRKLLKGLAMAIAAPLLPDITEQAALMQQAGTELINTNAGLTELRAGLGAMEGRVARRSAELASTETGLKLAESDLLSADPYETATALETAATRLEALYAITTRLARLTLADYLR